MVGKGLDEKMDEALNNVRKMRQRNIELTQDFKKVLEAIDCLFEESDNLAILTKRAINAAELVVEEAKELQKTRREEKLK